MRIIFLLLFLCGSMAGYAQQQPVNVGTTSNDHTGDPARTAFIKLNANDAELYNNIVASGDATGTNAYSVSPDPAITTYVANQKWIINFANTNTTISTLVINGLSVKTIKKTSSGTLVDVASGDLSGPILLQYNGTYLVVVGSVSSSSSGVTSITVTSPLTGGIITSTGTIGLGNALADGSTKGAASFNPSDFDATLGNISLDYAGGQKATGSIPGFLSAADFTTLSAKQSAITFGTGVQSALGINPGSNGSVLINPSNTSGVLTNNGSGALTWAAAGGLGTVTSVTSATGDATVATTTTTPVITIVSAPKLTTPRNINGTSFDGTGNITVTAVPSGSAGGDLTGTYPNPTLATSGVTAATYGSATQSTQVTYDAKGRATSASSVTIAIPESAVTNLTSDLAGKQAAFGTQTANYGYFGPPSGSAATPTFRQSVVADLPFEEFITDATTSRTLSATDRGKVIRFTSTSAITVTLPSGITSGFSCVLVKAAAGDITLTTSSSTLEGATTISGSVPSFGVIINRGSDIWITNGTGLASVTGLGTIDTQSKSSNGAVISGSSLYFQTADATNPGLVSATAQTFAGPKTIPRVIYGAGATTAASAPIQFTSGTNMTTAEAGSIEYDGTKLYMTNSGAQRQELPQIQQSRVSTQFDATSTTTLANITGLTSTLVAAKVYRFEATIYTTSNVAGGVKFAVSGTATATAIIDEAVVFDNSVVAAQTRATAISTSVGGITTVTNGLCRITGTITVNAAGTLTIQFAQNASNGTASSVLVGSNFVVTQMN